MLLCTQKCLRQNVLQQVNEFARTKHIRTKQLSSYPVATSAADLKGKLEIISTSVNFN
jgi:hypothetical protein